MKKNFGIIGNPIKHSLSPILHKYWFKKYNINADYSIIEATNKDLPNIIKKIKDGSYSGFNVTLPFKQQIINSNTSSNKLDKFKDILFLKNHLNLSNGKSLFNSSKRDI